MLRKSSEQKLWFYPSRQLFLLRFFLGFSSLSTVTDSLAVFPLAHVNLLVYHRLASGIHMRVKCQIEVNKRCPFVHSTIIHKNLHNHRVDRIHLYICIIHPQIMPKTSRSDSLELHSASSFSIRNYKQPPDHSLSRPTKFSVSPPPTNTRVPNTLSQSAVVWEALCC